MLGKLATHEFALGGPSFDLPVPRQRATHVGSDAFHRRLVEWRGAAVAAGLVLGALGSDTGGSIRTPAAFWRHHRAEADLQPGQPFWRALPLAFSLDHVGPMAWTVGDCAILLQAIAGHDARDPASADRPVDDYGVDLKRGIKGLRIGVIRHFFADDHPVSTASLDAIDRDDCGFEGTWRRDSRCSLVAAR